MQRYGPDSWFSWAVAGVAGLIQVPVLFSLKTMGVVFIGLLSEWHLSRHEASWPLTLFVVSSQILGPVLPLFQRIMPATAVLALSCVLSSVSLMLSYFAKNFIHMSIVLAVHGFSLAAIYIFSTLLLMQHFKEKRTAANAVTSTISAAITILAPTAMQALVTSYGVRNALLIVGLLGLLVVPFSLGLRTPQWYSAQGDNTGDANNRSSPGVEVNDLLDGEKGQSPVAETSSSRSGASLTGSSTRQRYYMLTPRFLAQVISVTVTYNSMNLFLLLAFDHALDIGIPLSTALYILPTYSCGDLLARLSSGIAIDAKCISWQAVLAIGFTAEAICLVILANNTLPVVVIGLSFMVGCTCGAKTALVPVQLANDFGLHRLVASSGAALFICGCVTISRPFLVGYFRDVQGSYNGIFLVVAFCCAICSVYWVCRVARPKQFVPLDKVAREND